MADEKPAQPKHEDLSARVQQLEAALAATQAALPVSLIPEHGAGVKTDVAPTWSQAEQAEAKKRFP